jgi:ABC-type branched-subunit amino acid transport system ATPase component
VRIAAVRIENFRGIRFLEVDGLAREPLITVSGPNGSGKSLVLEAISLAWRVDRLPSMLLPQFTVGPWGRQARIELGLVLVGEERRALETVRDAIGGPEGEAPSEVRVCLTISAPAEQYADPTPPIFESSPWIGLTRHPAFSASHGFAQIDHLPADRPTGRGEAPQINPALIGEEQRENLRNQVVSSYAQTRGYVGVGGIAPLLATADYLDFLAEREGRERAGDFEAITGPFFEATGKEIELPRVDHGSPHGASIRVRTLAGTEHTLDQLSSGEQEVLALSYFVRRLSARGGVLLIDEPELHLHPALQRAFFADLSAIADRAQVCIVTHSPRLVTAASLPGVLHVRPAGREVENQLSRLDDERDRLALLDDLGIHPIELLQSRFLVIVEGTTDAQRIAAILPLELSSAVVSIAGNAQAVESACRSLESAEGVPFIAVRDRDLMDDEARESLLGAHPGLYVWPKRSLENVLLHPPLIAETLRRAGAASSEAEVVTTLRGLADSHKPHVAKELLEIELARRHGYSPHGDDPVSKLRSFYEESRRVVDEKLREFDEVRSAVELRVGGALAGRLGDHDGRQARFG